jgi:hypothetical protein
MVTSLSRSGCPKAIRIAGAADASFRGQAVNGELDPRLELAPLHPGGRRVEHGPYFAEIRMLWAADSRFFCAKI